MIDLNRECLLTLAQAADSLPCRRRGRKTHISTLYRWTKNGCRGLIHDSIQIGVTRSTSRQAMQDFFERLSPSIARDGTVPSITTSSNKRKRSEAAAKEL